MTNYILQSVTVYRNKLYSLCFIVRTKSNIDERILQLIFIVHVSVFSGDFLKKETVRIYTVGVPRWPETAIVVILTIYCLYAGGQLGKM